jgi:dTDP-4-amino-4,6-dideoxygalactose transaminase
MNAICELAAKHSITVIEDNAHGLCGKYHGKPLGTFGQLATQSFHETKNFSCGEGGALVINDSTHFDRAEILREKGTNRSRFFRGQVDKYSWVDLGSSFLPSDLLAALLCANLEVADDIQNKRKAIWESYDLNLAQWADANNIRQPIVPSHCDQAWHMYYLIMPDLANRTAFIEHMSRHDIKAVFHYLPLHLSQYGSRFGFNEGDCPVTEDVSDRLVRLPFFESMSQSEQEQVILTAREFECKL